MADFVPELQNPNDPDSIAEWARAVANLINGHVSIGEPVSENTTMFPNGVKGHLLGSYVVVTQTTQAQILTCTHNLNITPKGLTAVPIHTDPLNVAWEVVRIRHDGTLLAGPPAGGPGLPVFVGGAGSVTANSIQLRFRVDGYDVVATPMIWELWFFPTTR